MSPPAETAAAKHNSRESSVFPSPPEPFNGYYYKNAHRAPTEPLFYPRSQIAFHGDKPHRPALSGLANCLDVTSPNEPEADLAVVSVTIAVKARMVGNIGEQRGGAVDLAAGSNVNLAPGAA